MTTRRVRVGRRYVFDPVGFDLFDPGPARPDTGTVVEVVNLTGCPPANTMGHCYVREVDTGRFGGLVLTNSLRPL